MIMEFLQSIIDLLISLLPQVETIEPDERGVYVFFGRWRVEVGPGLYIIWPWCINMGSDGCTPRINGFKSQSLTTADEVSVAVDSAVAYRVRSPSKALYEVQDYEESLGNLMQGEIGNYVCTHSWVECRNIENMRKEVLKAIRESSKGWGLFIKEVYITSFVKHRALRIMGVADSIASREGE